MAIPFQMVFLKDRFISAENKTNIRHFEMEATLPLFLRERQVFILAVKKLGSMKV